MLFSGHMCYVTSYKCVVSRYMCVIWNDACVAYNMTCYKREIKCYNAKTMFEPKNNVTLFLIQNALHTALVYMLLV